MSAVRHPAKWSNQLEPTIREWLADVDGPILDPMAGTGKFGFATHYNEIEPEWAAQCPGIVTVGDARKLPYPDGYFAAVVTSPTYGNRMADHHKAKDKCSLCKGTGDDPSRTGPRSHGRRCRRCQGRGLSPRKSYRDHLGRPLTPGNSGRMQWGPTYREVHAAIWQETFRVLRPGGTFVLNIKDHIRAWRAQGVPAWHYRAAQGVGFRAAGVRRISCPGNRQGQNGQARVDHEYLIRFTKPTN